MFFSINRSAQNKPDIAWNTENKPILKGTEANYELLSIERHRVFELEYCRFFNMILTCI